LLDRYRVRAAELAGPSLRWANIRLALFFTALGFTVVGLRHPAEPAIWALLVAAASVVAFVAAVVKHGQVKRAEQRVEALQTINEQALGRLERDWEAFPGAPVLLPERLPEETADLDLLGRASLFHLAGTTSTELGGTTLASWFLAPADVDTVRRRQPAVRELGGMLDLRQEIQLLGQLLTSKAPDTVNLVRWSERPSWYEGQGWVIWAARLLALVITALMLWWLPQWRSAVMWWVIPVSIGLVLTWSRLKSMGPAFAEVSMGAWAFSHYADALEEVSKATFQSPLLQDLQRDLVAGQQSAHVQLRRLDRILGLVNVRASGMAHFFFQGFLLWDFHTLWLLDRWRDDNRGQVRRWLEALGEFEALCALGGLRHDHPDWAFPEFVDGSERQLSATGLGHPLLHPGKAVVNDVRVGPRGSFLLVTGSNMSGKSTLLRAIGVNVVLAQAGAPVMARAMALPPVTLGTSFRIRDSLEDGVSYFMAELQRLKEVVDLAARTGGDEERPLLYLFDEILLGTNVVERQIAVQQVIASLVREGAIGAIATHDLTLADADGLAEACQPVHFTETFTEVDGEPQMSFDYTLRDGVAPTTNALKLLQIVGLGQAADV